MGHVQKRDTGKYRARYIGDDGLERSRTFDRKVDAERFLAQTEVAKQRGEWVDPRLGRLTYGQWFEEWEAARQGMRDSTRAQHELYGKNHILPRWGHMPLAQIDDLAVQRWVNELTAKGLAPGTVRKIQQIAGMPMKAAVKARLIPRSPFVDLDLPPEQDVEMRFLAPNEVASLATTMHPRYSDAVPFKAYSGLRIGELAAVQATRIDLLRGEVEVALTLTNVKGKLQLGPPKTKQGRRRVPLPRPIIEMIAERVSQMAKDDFVFAAPNGGPLDVNTFRSRFWYPAVEAAGLAPLRIHDLRDTAVAFWIAAGASPLEVARRAGHRSVVTVLDRYGHLLPGIEHHVNDRLAAMFEAASDSVRDADVRPLLRDLG